MLSQASKKSIIISGWHLRHRRGDQAGSVDVLAGRIQRILSIENVFQVGKQIGTDDGATHWDFPSANPYIDFARTESQEGINPPEEGDSCNPSGHTFCDSQTAAISLIAEKASTSSSAETP